MECEATGKRARLDRTGMLPRAGKLPQRDSLNADADDAANWRRRPARLGAIMLLHAFVLPPSSVLWPRTRVRVRVRAVRVLVMFVLMSDVHEHVGYPGLVNNVDFNEICHADDAVVITNNALAMNKLITLGYITSTKYS